MLPIEDAPAEPVADEDRIIIARPAVPEGERQKKTKSAHVPSMPRQGAANKRPAPGGSSGSGGPGPSTPPPPIHGPGDGGGADPPVALPPPLEAPAREASDDEIRVGPATSEMPVKRRKLGREWKDALCDTVIQYTPYVVPKVYKNYILKCNRWPGDCHKTCGRTEKNMQHHGELEPLAYLHAWLLMDVDGDKKHSTCDPDPAAVDDFLAHNEEALQDLFHTCVPDG